MGAGDAPRLYAERLSAGPPLGSGSGSVPAATVAEARAVDPVRGTSSLWPRNRGARLIGGLLAAPACPWLRPAGSPSGPS